MLEPYNPADWFWIVGGDTSRAFSSKADAWVQSWPASRVTRIDSEDSLDAVLVAAGVRKTKIDKAAIWAALTDQEVDLVEAEFATKPARLRRIWNDSLVIDTRGQFYGILRGVFVQALGAQRTNAVFKANR